jgi:flagellin
MISLQTNYASLVGQQNMNTNQIFQTKTIQSLTSGYRINSSGDDAAGLAVANGYRSNIAELTQGVLNGNNGINTLQIVDGGLNNISTMLDRMKTLATESASGTFTGNRATLDQEYQSLKTEITRQATNIGLVSGGNNAKNLSVYIGGAPTGASLDSSAVNVDLSAALVDATSLGLGSSSTINTGGGGTYAGGATLGNLTSTKSVALGANPVSFNVYSGNNHASISLTGTATVGQFIDAINSQIAASGITGVSADLNAKTGQIEFQGSNFALGVVTDAGHNLILKAGDTSAATASGSMYDSAASAYVTATTAQTLNFTVGGQNHTLTLANGTDAAGAVDAINNFANSLGVYATQDQGGNIYFEGNSQFTVTAAGGSATNGFTAGAIASGATTGNGSTLADATQNARDAVTAINNALSFLGNVQGTVGAGENKIQYAVSLASSQITNFSSAQSSIRDADVATEAANLTKAQVLQQASIAAMAQANSAPQSVLKLLG